MCGLKLSFDLTFKVSKEKIARRMLTTALDTYVKMVVRVLTVSIHTAVDASQILQEIIVRLMWMNAPPGKDPNTFT